jgi:L-asparagine transporter-like permease
VSLIALGGIIGSSYFLGTGYVLGQVGPCAFLAYILGGILSYWVLACLSELAIEAKSKGSFVGYARDWISPTFACGIGWSYWASWVVYVPSECIAAGIIMHYFFPSIPEHLFSILCGGIITLINFSKVKLFGEVEFWFSLVKIALLIGFSILALLIFLGVFRTDHLVGTEYLLHEGGFFPNGMLILFLNMVVLLFTFFFSAHAIYANLLGMSGFTGTVCWISICWSQLRFRKRMGAKKIVPYGISWFPISTHLAIWIQVLCLFVVILSPELRVSFYFGVPVLLLPMLCYQLYLRKFFG